MNKFYLSALTVVIATGGAFAQTKSQMPLKQRVKPTLDAQQHNYNPNRGGVTPIWADDFSNASTWTLATWPGAPVLNWQIGVGLENSGQFPTTPIASTTASNGYAMLDSDGFANQSLVESSMMTTANPIDLNAVSNVVLQFETFYRKWTAEECYIVISTNNTDWPELTPTTDISGLPNVFKAFPGMAVQEVISNPTLVRINISAAAGGQSQVWVRFHWTGTYGYSWFVDDVAIIEQPANDVVLNYSFLSHTGNGEEYGRTPASQLNSTMLVGGEYYNFGYDTQTNISVEMEVFNAQNQVVFSANHTQGSLPTETSGMMEQTVNLPALSNGLYRALTTVTSAQETGGLFFANNDHERNFTITDLYYTLDGVGTHPAGYQALGSLGSNSFTDAEDGLMIFTYYEVAQPLEVKGIEILLQSTTVAGGAVIVSIHDSSDVRAGVVTNAIYQSEVLDVTSAHVAAGVIQVVFPSSVNLTSGGYYAAVELFSGGTNHIRIINDLTVPQPALASMIYIPDDDVYTNGNASAIRLMTDPTLSIGDLSKLQGVSLFPNPSNGLLNISTPSMERFTVEVFNVLGENVVTTAITGNSTLDLTGNTAGVYMVRVSSNEATVTQRIILN
jgi:hypothetical protein